MVGEGWLEMQSNRGCGSGCDFLEVEHMFSREACHARRAFCFKCLLGVLLVLESNTVDGEAMGG